jgi:hypothetical protein
MASTALQMVNRVLKNLGQSEVATFTTTDRSSLALEHVNQAARSLFEEGNWDWLHRHDGYLRLRPKHDTELVSINDEDSAITDYDGNTITRAQVIVNAALTQNDDVIFDDVGAYFRYPGDSKWSDLLTKIQGMVDDAAVIHSFILDHVWHTDVVTPSDNAAEIWFPEYVLPDYVQTVTSARYQQGDIAVEFADPDVGFDRAVPRPVSEEGEPRVLVVGGLGEQTIINSTSQIFGTRPRQGLRAWISPLPDDDYLVNYSYRIKPTALTATTDTMLGVPESAIDRIVEDATAEMMLTVPTSDVTLGEINRRASLQKRERVAAMHRPDKGRRFSIKSLDRMGSGGRRRDRKQTFGSLTLDG